MCRASLSQRTLDQGQHGLNARCRDNRFAETGKVMESEHCEREVAPRYRGLSSLESQSARGGHAALSRCDPGASSFPVTFPESGYWASHEIRLRERGLRGREIAEEGARLGEVHQWAGECADGIELAGYGCSLLQQTN